jgi:hypothetical protein
MVGLTLSQKNDLETEHAICYFRINKAGVFPESAGFLKVCSSGGKSFLTV